ncbi:MAG TPA: LapA family protein [Microlunatus sp.]|jgi:putative membrane protein|nr:LapA family protein [Microlunatus sp.]
MAAQEPVQPSTSQRPADTSAARESGVPRQIKKTPRSRAGAAWVGICIAAVVVMALIIFLLQNRQPVLVTFLSMEATVPLAIALLIAGIGVGIVALVIGTIRIGQLRRRLSHERQSSGA